MDSEKLGSKSSLIGGGTVEGDLEITRDLTMGSTMSIYGYRYTSIPPGSVRNISATGISGTDINGRSVILVQGSGGPVTVTATPSIPNGSNGQFLLLMGFNDANPLTLQDESSLAGSNLQLAGGADAVLGEYDTLFLYWIAAKATWVEISRSNN